ncbi:hypothetical protein ABLO26_03545 [Neobacillus sp. 179-J 1A1 HS]|uniref:hypothetical protein n=1 Tax=Neobacillus driksii TaxID=3035913 RepID=UPI0035BC1DC2
MTLVLSASLSGQLAFMTSDTRVVRAKYKTWDLDAGEAERDENEPLVVCDHKQSKTHRLSDFVLLGAGGIAELSMHLTDILKQEVKPEHDLADCRQILEAVIERERANKDGPDFLNFLNIDEGVSVIMNGFYRDGCTGLVCFKAGKDAKVTEDKSLNGYQYTLIAPAKEYLRRTEELFNIPKLKDESIFEGLSPVERGKIVFQTIFDHLVMIHGVTSYNHPVEISPDFEVHIITVEDGVHRYHLSQIDLTETHKLYDELKALA